MPADNGGSDLRTQEGERRLHAQGGTRLNQSGPRPFHCTETIEAQSGASEPSRRWARGGFGGEWWEEQRKPRSQVSETVGNRATRSEGKEQRSDQGNERSRTYWAKAQEGGIVGKKGN